MNNFNKYSDIKLPNLAISIVLYNTEKEELDGLLDSLSKESHAINGFDVFLLDNSPKQNQNKISGWVDAHKDKFRSLHYEASQWNLGFGQGHNKVFEKTYKKGDYPYVLILNQDIVIVKDSIKKLLETAIKDDDKESEKPVGVWEMRQVPYEHPKIYDPITLRTDWVAGAACLFKTKALKDVNGFDEAIFMYGEDVDISWRIVSKGYICKYVPKAPVLHYSYSEPWETKKTLIFEGCLTHLLLRARYGSIIRALRGWIMLFTEIIIPQEFEGRRKGLLKIIPRYFLKVFHFRKTGKELRKNPDLNATFYRWDYSIRREGIFYETDLIENWEKKPLVSVIIRTYKRPAALKEALISVINQTYENIEIIVVEDNGNESDNVIKELSKDFKDIKYFPQKEHLGRSRCGNIGLSKATGEWLCFLDDDDIFFADHIQVLLQTIFKENKKAAYSLSWEVPTTITDKDNWKYKEHDYINSYVASFSKLAILNYNYFPIQSVLFNRSLYEEYGGFSENLNELEDWDLWIRYSFLNDFAYCKKTTSKYRIPSDYNEAVDRAHNIDKSINKILENQKSLGYIKISAEGIKNLLKDYNKHCDGFAKANSFATSLQGKNKLQRFLYRLKIKIRSIL